MPEISFAADQVHGPGINQQTQLGAVGGLLGLGRAPCQRGEEDRHVTERNEIGIIFYL